MANESILVLDCGGADAFQIARAVRSIGVYCEIVDARRGFEGFAGRNPAGMIALGGIGGAAEMPPVLLASGVPILALGGAARSLLTAAGGTAGEAAIENRVIDMRVDESARLFDQVAGGMRRIERAYALELPEGFAALADSEGTALAFGDAKRALYGMQFPLERNDVDGYRVLTNFVLGICKCDGGWTLESYLEQAVSGIRNRAKDGVAICPMTGGVDTAVCAALTYRALGDRARCILIDTGLMAQGEAVGVERAFNETMNVPITRLDVSDRFLRVLSGVTDPVKKRQIVAAEFSALLREQEAALAGDNVFLIRGTIYDDVLGGVMNLATLGAPERWVALEPLRGLFKHEVREMGVMLGMPEGIVRRQPLPSAGLAVRCMGSVTPERIEALRAVDAVFKRTLEEAGANKGLQMYFAALAGVYTLDDGGERSGETVILRAVQQRDTGHMHPARMPFDLLETVTNAILREVRGVTRVLYDLTPRPPAAVEYE